MPARGTRWPWRSSAAGDRDRQALHHRGELHRPGRVLPRRWRGRGGAQLRDWFLATVREHTDLRADRLPSRASPWYQTWTWLGHAAPPSRAATCWAGHHPSFTGPDRPRGRGVPHRRAVGRSTLGSLVEHRFHVHDGRPVQRLQVPDVNPCAVDRDDRHPVQPDRVRPGRANGCGTRPSPADPDHREDEPSARPCARDPATSPRSLRCPPRLRMPWRIACSKTRHASAILVSLLGSLVAVHQWRLVHPIGCTTYLPPVTLPPSRTPLCPNPSGPAGTRGSAG